MSNSTQVLGTIIASALNYDQLCESIQETPAIDNTKSTYVPCYGRSILGSKLEKLTVVGPKQPEPANHILTSPDLRGKFIRGLNLFYSVGEPKIDFAKADPNGQGRNVGDYQADELNAHSHSAASSGGLAHAQTYGMGIQSNQGQQVDFMAPSITVNTTGGAETRPRNVAVYYYIKIN
jgi:hypothetical protein